MGSLSMPNTIVPPSPAHLGIVVARYKEPLDPWGPFAQNSYLYAKYPTPQANDTVPHSSFRAYVELPNLGREGHTYLNHIVDHYDELEDIVIFSQADPFDQIAPVTNTTAEMVEKALDTKKDDVTVFNPSLFRDVAEWKKINWSSPEEEFWITESQIEDLTYAPYNMGEYFKKILHVPHPPAIKALHGACFAVTRETIRRNPKDVYERALAEFLPGGGGDGSLDPEVGFFQERLWCPMFSRKFWLWGRHDRP